MVDYGKCEECGKDLDGIAYFTNQKVCRKCIDKKHKEVTGRR